jgi:hypothetical protein
MLRTLAIFLALVGMTSAAFATSDPPEAQKGLRADPSVVKRGNTRRTIEALIKTFGKKPVVAKGGRGR